MRIKIYIVALKNEEKGLLRGIDIAVYLSKKHAEKVAERLNKTEKTPYFEEYEWHVFTRWLKLF